MAIIVKLDDMLYRRRVTLTELSSKVGITLANLSILKTGKAKGIRFATLEAICEALDCKPGDLLDFERVAEPDDDAPALAVSGGRS
ncbi:helix-turn-helix domain-containing protein [Allosphingosinicella sp.]|jgi:putative transcriptional regulator|uniref:helix-turn-helix domain-containing protein n=1 Tax=Allosphingosinicella sp. TaxID=2823234 RepID=UPI002EFE1B93